MDIFYSFWRIKQFFFSLLAWIGKKAADIRLRTAKETDIRIRVMNEIIHGIQAIKMFAWENLFINIVSKIRM